LVTLKTSKESNPLVSIIIPCQSIDDYARECVAHCLRQTYKQIEVIVLPDFDSVSLPNCQVIPTGHVTPSIKRNIGVKHSKGQICAFVDSDAYPAKSWVERAVELLAGPDVVAVGGPGLTPKEDDTMQRAGGLILSSVAGGGRYSFRYASKSTREVDELPSANLFIRKGILEHLGGFDPRYYPGEDSILCYQIVYEMKKKILYDPRIIVYHHRRPLFVPHLRQIWRYGLDTGYQIRKRMPHQSGGAFRLLPSLFVLGLLLGFIVSLFNDTLRLIFFSVLSLYLFSAILASLGTGDFKLGLFVFIGLILTHLSYGTGFLRGLMTKTLEKPGEEVLREQFFTQTQETAEAIRYKE